MFSGIITEIGVVTELAQRADSAVLSVQAAMFRSQGQASGVKIGDSIANSGVCLTVVGFDPDSSVARFDISSETLRCTTLGQLSVGSRINLEQSLRYGDRVDGHLVQGHVDCVAEVLDLQREADTLKIRFLLPEAVRPYLVKKGSVAVDGVSLTVGEVDEQSFNVYLIPLTLEKTILSDCKVGTKVNIEADAMARYAKRVLEFSEELKRDVWERQ